jgi:hypothetical protein
MSGKPVSQRANSKRHGLIPNKCSFLVSRFSSPDTRNHRPSLYLLSCLNLHYMYRVSVIFKLKWTVFENPQGHGKSDIDHLSTLNWTHTFPIHSSENFHAEHGNCVMTPAIYVHLQNLKVSDLS